MTTSNFNILSSRSEAEGPNFKHQISTNCHPEAKLKDQTSNLKLLHMKRKLLLLSFMFFLLTTSLLFFSFKSKITHFADFWEQLGVTEVKGREKIQGSFLTGYLWTSGVKNFKNIVLGERKAVTTDLLNYTKNYVQSAEFAKAYQANKLTVKPRDGSRKPKTEAQMREEKIAEAKKAIANYEKGLQTTTAADIKKIYEDGIAQQKKMIADYEDPKSETIPSMAKYQQQLYERDVKRYEDNLKRWEEEYPTDPSKYVRKRLEEVLSATEGIDYNAELVEKNGKKYFVKQEYEKKHNNWKYGFRAGKEVTETVRDFVKSWITEI